MSELPAALRVALDAALEGAPRKGLIERAQRTSEAYRAGKPSAGTIREADDALAYALVRAPATYAACARVFAEAARCAPTFAPKTLLDAGVGTGAASWAAVAVWPALEAATWLDASAPFLGMARDLAARGPAALKSAEARRCDLTVRGPWPRADLVIASYALAEIGADGQDSLINELWTSTEGLLVLVEPGTPAGYGRLLQARERLIGLGAGIAAPCAHALACPLTAPDWCHFSVRLPRSRDHRLAKGGEVPFEDEKFSYLVAARPGMALVPAGPRILAPPRAGKPGTEFRLCGPDGAFERRLVGKRDKAAFAAVRRLGWGDSLE